MYVRYLRHNQIVTKHFSSYCLLPSDWFFVVLCGEFSQPNHPIFRCTVEPILQPNQLIFRCPVIGNFTAKSYDFPLYCVAIFHRQTLFVRYSQIISEQFFVSLCSSFCHTYIYIRTHHDFGTEKLYRLIFRSIVYHLSNHSLSTIQSTLHVKASTP